jgi:outer membrane protein assembly factor BamB
MDIVSRIQTNDAITVSPAYLPPIPEISSEFGVLFFGSNDGFVMAVREDGVLLWQFPTGEKIVQSPVAIGDRVYFSSQHEGLYCVDAKPDSATRALKHWFAPGAIKFLAANKKHVYAADRPGNVLVLDANTGEQIDSLEAAKMPTKLMNAQTDRLYLATSDGLIQCLHEVGLKEPLRYDLERKQAAEAAKPATSKKAPGKAGEKTAPDKKDGKTEEAKPETTEGGEDNPFNP